MANEGYIPYGLNRARGYMDDIQESRSRMRDANIRKELVGGEKLQAGMEQAIDIGVKGYSDASDRAASAAQRDATKKFNKIRAGTEVDALDGTIEAMEELVKTTTDPTQKVAMLEKLAGYKKRRAMWVAARDATNMEEFAKIAGAQSKIDNDLQKTKARVAERRAGESVVTDVLRASLSAGDMRVDEDISVREDMPSGSERLAGLALKTALDRYDLSGPTQEIDQPQIRNIPSTPMDFINPINAGFFRSRNTPEYPETKKKTKLNETDFYNRE